MSKIISKKPPYRKLRGYAFDPSLSLELETAHINEITYRVSWEKDLQPGPDGEYIKVVDRDPSSKCTYRPVDLNEQHTLANEGLEPSESNPQFHQQMVYAVAMNTIKNFEKAIGRKIQWSPVTEDITQYVIKDVKKRDPKHPVYSRRFIDKLLLFPHAFRGPNAYYSSDRKAILFGYFNATPASADLHMPGSIVYSCLSHDIIAHEVTHAILDGMFSRFMEPTHPDVWAFHEAFADMVALFQHFTFANVMQHEIAKTKGTFNAETLLGKLAVEFGKASGSHGSLRDAIGKKEGGKWERAKPDLNEYRTKFECHDRGSILVAAVFDAFINIYNHRSTEIIKIATGGTGVLPAGELNNYLVNSLAAEAAKTASHVLKMCIRALDYCPPVDINFGDYLRALVTADAELVNDDKYNYRIAFIDAFRKRGIYPEGINNLSVESLVYSADEDSALLDEFAELLSDFLKEFKNEISYVEDRRMLFNTVRKFIVGKKGLSLFEEGERFKGLQDHLVEKIFDDEKYAKAFEKLTGLAISKNFKQLHVHASGKYPGRASIDIQDIRLNNRVGPDGNIQNQVIILLTQSCGVKVEHDEDNNTYNTSTFQHNPVDDFGDGSFLFRGGCTLVFDLNTGKQVDGKKKEKTATLKYVISKPILDMPGINKRKPVYKPNQTRAVMQYRCQYGNYAESTGIAALKKQVEPLSHIHKHNSK
ncbi:MAG: hypothetical protein WAT20_15415 [Ferruginibacter sp.]|nr:hypothetical protein [Chitinophagaceae bacterium]